MKFRFTNILFYLIYFAVVVFIGYCVYFFINVMPAKKIKIDLDPVYLNIGDTVKLNISSSLLNNKDSKMTLESSNSSVIQVDDKGNVTALNNGNSTITITIVSGKEKESRVVNAICNHDDVKVLGFSLDKHSITVKVGETIKVNYSIFPTNATNKEIHLDSVDDSVASISSTGDIIGVKAGSVTVNAMSKDGHFEDNIKVKVVK